MKYRKQIDETYSMYEEDKKLEDAHIFHLYPIKNSYGLDDDGLRGYHDSQMFTVVAFNYDKKKKVNLGTHDGVSFETKPYQVRIFLDGSTMILFRDKSHSWKDFGCLQIN